MHPFLGAQTDIPAPKVPSSSIQHWSGKTQFEPYGSFKFLFHFLIFLANFYQQTIQFDPYCPFKNFINSSFFLFQTFMKKKSRTKWFDPGCPFKILDKFSTNLPKIFEILLRNFKKEKYGVTYIDFSGKLI